MAARGERRQVRAGEV
ncbi:hypothetical protein, partial [Frankia sp. AvcI1]